MRIEPKRPYGLPNSLQESKESGADRAKLLLEKSTNAAGDQFELSSEQRVRQNLVGDTSSAFAPQALSPERALEISTRVKSGYYLTSGSAEETAQALTRFHS